jgi:hypothetical protein
MPPDPPRRAPAGDEQALLYASERSGGAGARERARRESAQRERAPAPRPPLKVLPASAHTSNHGRSDPSGLHVVNQQDEEEERGDVFTVALAHLSIRRQDRQDSVVLI